LTEAQTLSLAVCLVLAACHLAAVPLWARLKPWTAQVASFSGGAASAYVFLHLFPELEDTHATIGERIHGIVLFGFVLLFALDTLISSLPEGEHGRRRFQMRLAFAALYNLLLAFTMSEQLPLTPATAVTYTLALGLHLISVDLALVESFGPKAHGGGRFVLAGAILVGWTLSLVTDAPEVTLDVLTALMAGFIIFTVFGEEIPKRGGRRLLWFVVGTGIYFLLEFLTHA
jgi:hypothetical protein